MAKTPAPQTEPPRRALSRPLQVLLGIVLGGAWGSVMWLIFEIAGRESGARGWAYLAFTTAMIGAGVAAIFGISSARRGRTR